MTVLKDFNILPSRILERMLSSLRVLSQQASSRSHHGFPRSDLSIIFKCLVSALLSGGGRGPSALFTEMYPVFIQDSALLARAGRGGEKTATQRGAWILRATWCPSPSQLHSFVGSPGIQVPCTWLGAEAGTSSGSWVWIPSHFAAARMPHRERGGAKLRLIFFFFPFTRAFCAPGSLSPWDCFGPLVRGEVTLLRAFPPNRAPPAAPEPTCASSHPGPSAPAPGQCPSPRGVAPRPVRGW